MRRDIILLTWTLCAIAASCSGSSGSDEHHDASKPEAGKDATNDVNPAKDVDTISPDASDASGIIDASDASERPAIACQNTERAFTDVRNAAVVSDAG